MIKPEDRMFLMNAIIAMHHSNESKAKFVLGKANNDRLIAIKQSVSSKEFDEELTKLRKGLGYEM